MITAWAVTTGEAGMRTQARGLASAVADHVIEKTAPKGLIERLLRLDAAFAPPWPDVIISCGRRSAQFVVALRRRMPGRPLMVHIQDPRACAEAFDLIVAMEHDRIATGKRVLKVATALHDLTAANLAAAAQVWRARLAPLGRPLTGVLIGGSTARQAFTLEHGRGLLDCLRQVRSDGTALAIVPSRRTPRVVDEMLRHAFAQDAGVFHWDMAGDNPYRGVLALADRLVVTSDSVSMISEALATSATVEIFDFGTAHYGRFLSRMIERGWARRVNGAQWTPATRTPINATYEAAAAVRSLLEARTGSFG